MDFIKFMRCKNCKHWENPEKRRDHDFLTGTCAKEPYDVLNMNSQSFAIYCGHDGPVYTGEDFGCVNFELDESKQT